MKPVLFTNLTAICQRMDIFINPHLFPMYPNPIVWSRKKSSDRYCQSRHLRTIDEVIEKANNTPYGLSGGVWTDKGAKIFKITQKIRAGIMWANTFNKFDPASPFGGYKESGMGREGGLHGLYPYVELV
tara:strand:- start:272 stop:658 length:387 start_codon:yes stop_codon:yes gene_type:complete